MKENTSIFDDEILEIEEENISVKKKNKNSNIV
jgi:hypothetical protein